VAATAGLLIATASGCGSAGAVSGGAVSWGGVWGPAIVSADGRTLTVAGYATGCGITATLVARQSPTQVALRARDVVTSSCFPGEGAMPRPPPLEVRLDTALGRRKLLNGCTGRPVPQFDARLLLQPRILPPGYQLRQVYPQLTGTEGHAVAEVRLSYDAQTETAGYLLITESPDSPFVSPPWQSPADGSQWTRIRVRGVPAWAGPSVIAWRQRGLLYSVSASPPLTTTQLTAIADSATD
jgi:hypothetical protein